MKRTTLKELREALAVSPEERTEAQAAALAAWEAQTKQFTELPSVKTLVEQIARVPNSMPRLAVGLNSAITSSMHPRSDLFRNLGALGDLSRWNADDTSRLRESIEFAARERAERVRREHQMVTHLARIDEQLRGLTEALARQEEMLQEHDQEFVRVRSGVSGRPSSMHLILEELRRRALSGHLEETQAEQARVLCAWLAKTHRMAHPTKPKSATNNAAFRETYRRFRPKFRSRRS